MKENQNEFKVGDWVVGEDICHKSKNSTTISRLKEERNLCQFAWPYILENGSYCSKIKKWVPKEGDCCWTDFYGLVQIIKSFNYKFEVKCFYGIKNLNNNPIVKLEELEPFIGELPTRVKRLKEINANTNIKR